jgi:hypothetical protein
VLSELERTASGSRRRLGCGVALLALATAGAAHVLYWYAPRERPAAPAPGDLPARLLAAGPLPIRLWVPYPHQNLAVLDRAAADPRSTIAALVTVAGVRRARLPRFGPFRVPPSREICIASDTRGRRVVAVARVYPGLAALARLAGRMAGNPWLAGGEVELDGRPARTGWAGRGLWWVSNEPGFDPARLAPAHGLPSQPALAIVRLDAAVSLLPSGWFRLERRDGELRVFMDGGRELRLRLGMPP